eukprot:14579890-Heterocapsa_arctica.AAC.1
MKAPIQHKKWTAMTANITAWSTAGLEWAVHEEDEIILLQETRLSRKQIKGAKGKASSQGLDA